MSTVDILDAIDAAVGCQLCGGPLGNSPSDDFCCQEHQQAWCSARTEPLVGYEEPWGRPWDFPGVGTEAAVSGVRARPGFFQASSPVRVMVPQNGEWQDIGAVHPWDGLTFTMSASAPMNPTQPVVAGPDFGTVRFSWAPLEFRLPRSTGNLMADFRALERAHLAATTPEQQAACALRRADLSARMAKAYQHFPQRYVRGLPRA